MKLFLISHAISERLGAAFVALVGKKLSDIAFALIENAADPYPEEKRGFVYDIRKLLESYGMRLERIDLRDYRGRSDDLYKKLRVFDVLCCGGGNVFYLRWLMKETGFDTIIKKLTEEGVVYSGGSAGAIVAGKTLRHFELVDDPSMSPEIIFEGLGLTDLVVLPHWGVPKFQKGLEEIKRRYNNEGVDVVTIEDGQAVIVEDGSWRIV